MVDSQTKTDIGAWVVVYRTVGDIRYSLERLNLGERIEEAQMKQLREATESLLDSLGYGGERNILDINQRSKILEFLGGVNDKALIEKEGMKSKALNAQDLKVLVAEYEAAIAKGESKEAAEARFLKDSGQNIADFINRQIEIKNKLGIEETAAREIVAEEMVLGEKLPEEAMEIVTRGEVDVRKLRRVLGDKEPEVTEIMAGIKMTVEAEKLVSRTGIVNIPGLNEAVLARWRGETNLPISAFGQVSAVEAREIDEEIKRVGKINREVFEIEEMRVLREKIVGTIVGAPGNEEVAEDTANDYAEFVVGFYRNNPVRALRTEVQKGLGEEVGPGQFEEGFARTQVLHTILSQGRIEEKVRFFEEIVRKIPNFSTVDNIGPARVVNGMMAGMRIQMPDLMTARSRIGGIVDVIRSFGAGGMDKVILDLSKKVGGQPLIQFAQQTSLLMAQGKNLVTAMGLAIKGAGAKVAVGAGAKTAAGALGGPIGVAAMAVLSLVRPIFKKIGEIAESLGLSLGIKKWLRAKIGGAPGAVLGLAAGAGEKLVIVGGVVTAGAFAAAMAMIAPVVITVFVGFFAYQMFQSSQISSLVAPVNLGSGVGAETDTEVPDLAPIKVDGECEVRKKVLAGIKQNSGDWASKSLPNGCTFSDSGCGPTSVAKVLMKKDESLTPNFLVYENDSPYKNIGCDGSSLEQARLSLEKHLGAEAVDYNLVTRRCDKQDIADWICDGKVVMILANFYKNKALEIGGHYFLAVEVKNGEIYSEDPFYESGMVLSGEKAYGKVQAIRECLVIDGDKI